MVINNTILDNLTAQARSSPRRRMNLDLRTSSEDTSQRMLNAIEPDSVVPVHRHMNTAETIVLLRGRAIQEYYKDDGTCEASYELYPGGPIYALNIPAGQWHAIRSLESGTVILEMKDGPYHPIQDCDVQKA